MNIALFIYKRIELTEEIYLILEKIKPERLFIFADGPKNDSEHNLCQQTRAIFDNITWTSNVEKIYQSSNLGLGKSITEGLDYVFNKVEKVIVLEDDCIPSEHFFSFCEEMLEAHKDNHQILHINGTNILINNEALNDLEFSYYFSRISLPWGWATWKRAWKKFNKSYDTYSKHSTKILNEVSNKNRNDFDSFFSTSEGFIDTWDTQWLKDILYNNGLVITPKDNLISCKGGDINSSYMPQFCSIFSLIKYDGQKKAVQHNENIKVNDYLNLQCEDSLLQIIREFKFNNQNKNKTYEFTKGIVEYIQPIHINEDEITLAQIKEAILKNTPKYTALTISFYNNILQILPKFESISRGDWVEVGVWKGGAALFLRSMMKELDINTNLFLYDTFSEFPIHNITKEKDKDFMYSMELNKQNYKNSYLPEVQKLFQKFNLESNVHYKVNDINSLNTSDIPNKIALLFIDVDFYEPTYRTLELFYDSLISGAIVIIDDYLMQYLNCKDAVDDFFKLRDINFENKFIQISEFSVLFIKP